MIPERSVTRRRFTTLISGLGAATLAGCMDEGGEDGEGDGDGGEENDSDGSGESENAGQNGDGEDGEQDVPNVEGTNVFVRVVDAEEAAIRGATVTITGGSLDGEEFETDVDGRVIQQDVEPGEYTVTATTDGEGQEEKFTLEKGDDENLTFTFPASSEGGEKQGGNGESDD